MLIRCTEDEAGEIFKALFLVGFLAVGYAFYERRAGAMAFAGVSKKMTA